MTFKSGQIEKIINIIVFIESINYMPHILFAYGKNSSKTILIEPIALFVHSPHFDSRRKVIASPVTVDKRGYQLHLHYIIEYLRHLIVAAFQITVHGRKHMHNGCVFEMCDSAYGDALICDKQIKYQTSEHLIEYNIILDRQQSI